MLSLLRTTETACAELAASASISASLNCNIYTGLDNEAKEAPAIICGCLDASEDFAGSGIYHIKTDIVVKEIAADTNVTGSIADVIFEKFSTVSNSTLESRVSNLSILDVFIEGYKQHIDTDAWVQTLSIEIVGCLK